MIALSIFVVCINVRSFRDLVKLIASSLPCGSDCAVRKKKKKVLTLYFCLLVSIEQLKFEILSKKKKYCFPDFGACVYVYKYDGWRRASCMHGTRSCLMFFLPGELVGTAQERNAVPIRLAYALALRARNVYASLNPKPLL